MGLLQELQHHILEYVEGKEELSALRQWLAPVALDVDSCGDRDAIRAAYGIQRSVADHAEGFLSELQLKQNLVALLLPSPFISSYVSVGLLGSDQATVTTGTFIEVESGSPIGVGPALVYA
jgi:hypothetical protein